MRKIDIEAWVLDVVARVKAGQPIEDSRVEIKMDWIEANAAARRIAGHANAAGGESILWIIGLDEKGHRVSGASQNEMASWLSSVQSEFEGVSPEVRDLNVPTDGSTVVALLFETDRAPFVVSNPVHGKQGGGSVSHEVPWREGTKVRSANRSDLLKLLVPLQNSPVIDALKGILRLVTESGNKPNQIFTWILELTFYVTPKDAKRVVIPFHKCTGQIKGQGMDAVSLSRFMLDTEKRYSDGMLVSESRTLESTSAELIIDGPGMFQLRAEAETKVRPNVPGFMEINLALWPVNSDRLVPVIASMEARNTVSDQEIGRWILASS